MESLKFVLVCVAILNGHYAYGHNNGAGEEVLSETVKAVLQRTVNELTTKYDTAISELQTHIGALQKDNSDLKETVRTLKTEAATYDLRLNDLTRTVTEKTRHINTLEISNKQNTFHIETLENKLDAISPCKCSEKSDTVDSSSETTTTPVKPTMRNISTKNAPARHQGRMRRANVETEVAFYAYVTHSGLKDSLGINQDILFDHAVTNIGNGYVPHHGTFIAPVAGTYVFSATLHAPRHSRANFVVDGNVEAVFYGDTDEPTQVSQTIVVSLHKGADVSVQNMLANDSYYGAKYTTFTGFLLYQDFVNPAVVG